MEPWLVAAPVVVAVLACIPASIADSKGYSFGTFWALGLLFLLPALLVVLVLPHRDVDEDVVAPDSAIRNSQVARFLSDAEFPLSPHAIAQQASMTEQDVERQLSGLLDLDAARPDDTGRWSLSERGLSTVKDGARQA
jgi:hypothetical protein